MRKAIVRPPGNSFTRALTGQQPRPAIDVALARQQHLEYCAALRAAGLDLMTLPPVERYPDACFVQDTAVVLGELAILGRFGVESRQGEEAAVRRALQGQKRLVAIRSPGTLEGGDVLIMGSRVLVGLSARTNRAGFAQLRDWLELEGATVDALPVPAGLHLLSGCTYLGQGVLLATDAYADLPVFSGLDVVRVPPGEAYAANALGIGASVVLPAGHVHTADQLHARGFSVLAVDLSEFAKADGGATCLAVVF
jgi:dimethylargininase